MPKIDKDNIGTLKKSIEGGKWMFLDTFFQKLITFLSFLILARLLTPEDFGILAILLIIPDFLTLITTTGIETALIQKKEDPEPYLNPIWTFNIIKSIGAFILIFFLAPVIARFFQKEGIVLAIQLSGIFVLIPGISNVAKIFFTKEIDFKKIFIRDVASSIIYSVISVILAIFLKSFWPLFFGILASRLSDAITSYMLHKFRPKLNFNFKPLFNLINFSKWIYWQNMVSRISSAVENFLIAKMTSAVSVGLYTRAKSLAVIPISPFYNIITKVTFPAYSRLQNSYEKIRDGFLKSLDILFFVSIPFSFLMLEAGHQIILIVLGNKWVEMDLVLKILVVAIAINAFFITAMPILNAIGKPKTKFFIELANLLISSLSFIVLIPFYGIIGAAFGALITSVIISIISLQKISRILNIKIFNIIRKISIPLFTSAITLIVGKLILNFLEPISNTIFMILIIFLGIFYILLIAFLGKFFNIGPYNTLLIIFKELKSQVV